MPDTSACWPSNGELDIMEMFNGDGKIFGTYIYKVLGCSQPYTAVGRAADVGSDWATAWHEYAIEYDGLSAVAFALDSVPYSNVTEAAFFDVPNYVILDTSVGSRRAGEE